MGKPCCKLAKWHPKNVLHLNEHVVFPSTSKDICSNASEMNTEEVVCDEIDEDDETCCCWQGYNVWWCSSISKRIDVCPWWRKKTLLAYLQTKTLNIWLFQQFSVVRDIKEEMLLFITVKSVNMN